MAVAAASVWSGKLERGIGFEMGKEVKGRERLVECFVCLGRARSIAESSFCAESFDGDLRDGKVKADTWLCWLSTVCA